MVAGPHCCGFGGAPSSAGPEGLLKRNNTRWQLAGAPQIDVRVKPAAADIAQRRALCVVGHSCRFMRLRPTWGRSPKRTVNLTTVKTRSEGRLRGVTWRADLSHFLWL